MVVRITNKRIICQVVYSTIQGDIVLGSADSTELKNYGIPVGHTNYAPAYATGLLLARRVLKKMGMDDQYKGVEEATGEEYHVEENFEGRRPFKCLLDVGIVRTTTGVSLAHTFLRERFFDTSSFLFVSHPVHSADLSPVVVFYVEF